MLSKLSVLMPSIKFVKWGATGGGRNFTGGRPPGPPWNRPWLGVWGSAVSSPSGVWGAEIEFGAF